VWSTHELDAQGIDLSKGNQDTLACILDAKVLFQLPPPSPPFPPPPPILVSGELG